MSTLPVVTAANKSRYENPALRNHPLARDWFINSRLLAA
jgi:hypothetical protein